MLVASALMGIGIGLAFSALGNLIVEAVDPHQTGAAGGMNTVMRTIGGALGGQLAATFIAAHTLANGDPAVDGLRRRVRDGGRRSSSSAPVAALLVPAGGARTATPHPVEARTRRQAIGCAA